MPEAQYVPSSSRHKGKSRPIASALLTTPAASAWRPCLRHQAGGTAARQHVIRPANSQFDADAGSKFICRELGTAKLLSWAAVPATGSAIRKHSRGNCPQSGRHPSIPSFPIRRPPRPGAPTAAPAGKQGRSCGCITIPCLESIRSIHRPRDYLRPTIRSTASTLCALPLPRQDGLPPPCRSRKPGPGRIPAVPGFQDSYPPPS